MTVVLNIVSVFAKESNKILNPFISIIGQNLPKNSKNVSCDVSSIKGIVRTLSHKSHKSHNFT